MFKCLKFCSTGIQTFSNKCFNKDVTEYLDKYHNQSINKYKAKLINKHENKRIDKYKNNYIKKYILQT